MIIYFYDIRLSVDENAEHSHTVYTDDNFCAVQTGNNNAWKQGLVNINTTAVDGTFTHYIGTSGKSKPHNTMQPYQTVYIFKRTA